MKTVLKTSLVRTRKDVCVNPLECVNILRHRTLLQVANFQIMCNLKDENNLDDHLSSVCCKRFYDLHPLLEIVQFKAEIKMLQGRCTEKNNTFFKEGSIPRSLRSNVLNKKR